MDVTKVTQTNEFCLLSHVKKKKKKSNFQLLLLFFKVSFLLTFCHIFNIKLSKTNIFYKHYVKLLKIVVLKQT